MQEMVGEEVRAAMSRRAEIHELLAALLLAAATVLTAWSAYQAATWFSTETRQEAESAATRIDAARASDRSAALSEIDVNLWTQWLDAVFSEAGAHPRDAVTADGRYVPPPDSRSEFFHRSFRREFLPAFEAWLARDPFEDSAAPAAPFLMREYVVAEDVKADRLADRSDRLLAEGVEAGDEARAYVLLTVVFASVLALSGVAIKFRNLRTREMSIAVAVLILVVAAGYAATRSVDF